MADLTTITDGQLNGEGVFDKLMASVDAHIKKQFGSGNIDSEAYASVYVGSLQVVLQTAFDYTLRNEKQAEDLKLTQAQTDLIKEQTLTELSQRNKLLAETLLTNKQVEAAEANILFEEARARLTGLEADRYELESPKVLDRLDLDIEAASKQNLIADEQLLITKEQLLVAKQEVIKATSENAQILEQTKLIQEQTKVATEQVDKLIKEVEVLNAEIAKITKENLRIDSEKALLDQKKTTETAATQDITTGTIGKQQQLYVAQAQGFETDGKVKKTKALGDIYAVTKSNDPDATTPPDYLSKLNAILTQL